MVLFYIILKFVSFTQYALMVFQYYVIYRFVWYFDCWIVLHSNLVYSPSMDAHYGSGQCSTNTNDAVV